MAFHIRDPETDTLVRELARRKGVGLTEAVRIAAAAELKQEAAKTPLRERVRPLQIPRPAAEPELSVDKAFFDDLWSQGDD